MTKEEFHAALEIQGKIERLKAQLDTIQETGGLGAVRNSDISVKGGAGSVYPGQLAIEIEQEIQALKAQQVIERTIIQRFIDKQALDEDARKLLIYRYIDCMSWKNVAVRVGYNKRHVFKMHKAILENMALDGT